MSFVSRFLHLFLGKDETTLLLKSSRVRRNNESVSESELIRLESKVGQSIFGPLPNGVVSRDFFNLDKKTWIWREARQNQDGIVEEFVTRYEVQPGGVLKVLPGPQYRFLEGSELQNFIMAVHSYYNLVSREIYGAKPQVED